MQIFFCLLKSGNKFTDFKIIRLNLEVNNLTLKAPIPQNGQPHSNNSSATANELFEFV